MCKIISIQSLLFTSIIFQGCSSAGIENKTFPIESYTFSDSIVVDSNYTFYRDATLEMYKIKENNYVVVLNVYFGPPNFNSGLFKDTVQFYNNIGIGTPAEFDSTCKLYFIKSKDKIRIIQRSKSPFPCGFAHSVFADGVYLQKKK